MSKNESFQEVQMGTVVSQYPIDRFKFQKGNKQQIVILTKNPIVTKTHFIKDVGRIYYLDAAVQKGHRVTVHYNFLAVMLNTDQTGKQVMNENLTYGILSTGYEGYQALIDIHELNGDLTRTSLLITCTDAEYQKLNFTVNPQVPFFLKDKDKYKEVIENAKGFLPYIKKVIALELSEEDFLKKLGEVSAEDTKEFERAAVIQADGNDNVLSMENFGAEAEIGSGENKSKDKTLKEAKVQDAEIVKTEKESENSSENTGEDASLEKDKEFNTTSSEEIPEDKSKEFFNEAGDFGKM